MEYTFEWGTVTGEELGEFLSEIADHCGTDAAQFLMERFGGMTYSVPRKTSTFERMEDLGSDDTQPWLVEVAIKHSLRLARLIVALRGGEMFYFPHISRMKKYAARREVQMLYDGRNAGDLAVQFQIPRREVLQHAYKRAKRRE